MNAPRRAPRRNIDGVLLLDKPLGVTSNGALQAARRLYNAAKAGHTGTLDPLATGLLPICFGEATKFAGELLDADKTYAASLRLGITTDTGDAEGRSLQVRPVAVEPHQVAAVLKGFVGEILQLPPMHSALKRDGKPLYEYARKGIAVERTHRRVIIHSITLDACESETLSITVDCSKGTYIRTLAEDIGAALGCGAHLSALRRTRIGSLRLEQALTLAELEAAVGDQRDAMLASPDVLLEGLPRADLDATAAGQLCHGQPVTWRGSIGRWRAYSGTIFLGICDLADDGWLKPRRLVASKAQPTVANT